MNTFFTSVESKSREDQRLFSQRELIQDITEDILIAMNNLNISKAELAKRLGKSKAFVTQTLNGSRNMTLATLSDICFELDIKPSINIIPEEQRLTEEAKQILLEDKISETTLWHKEKSEPYKPKINPRHNNVITIDTHCNYQAA